MLNVQFSDSTETVIIAYFGDPQDPVSFPNQGQVSTTDPRWKTYYDSLPEIMKAWLPAPEQP